MVADSTSKTRCVIAVLSLTLAACGDATSPLQSVTFAPCFQVASFAFQPKGGQWSAVTGNQGSFTFQAPERLAIAYTVGNSAFLHYVTRDELAGFGSLSCSVGTFHQLLGTIGSLPAGSNARVSVANGSTVVTPVTGSVTNFQIVHTRDGDVDVVATSESVVAGQTQASRILLRRAQTLPQSSLGTLELLAAGSSHPLTPGSVTISGVNAGESASFAESYRTAGGTSHFLVLATGVPNGARANVGLPAALAVPGDIYIHNVTVSGTAPRSVIRYDDAAGDHALTIGPTLSTPTVATMTTVPPKLRLTLGAQAEYASFVHVRLTQNAAPSTGFGTVHRLDMILSSAYLGAPPATWTLETPDVAEIPDYPSTATFTLPANISWEVTAFQGPVAAFFTSEGHAPGTVVSSARRSGSTLIQ